MGSELRGHRLVPPNIITQAGRVIHHPDLGNNFRDQLSMTKKSYHRTLRNHNSRSPGDGTHVGGGSVTTAESQRHIHFCGHRVEVTARGKDCSFAAYDEATVQWRQFFDGSPQIEISDAE